MHRVVMLELEIIEPGCVSTIVGGWGFSCFPPPLLKQYDQYRYRRGKAESNDVDIVFTHPNGKRSVESLCKRLVRRLQERGMVTHTMRMSIILSADVDFDYCRPWRVSRTRHTAHETYLSREGIDCFCPPK